VFFSLFTSSLQGIKCLFFSGVNLKNSDLEGSQLGNVNLRVATLKGANLQNCILRGAVLAGADLEVRYTSNRLRRDAGGTGKALTRSIRILNARIYVCGPIRDFRDTGYLGKNSGIRERINSCSS